MKKLIPFAQRFVAGVSTRTVSARELHQFLSVRRDFSNWIKSRIEQYGFVENQDYLLVRQNGRIKTRGGDQRSVEYYLTLDMAKELSMVERTEQGKKARRYFIECEKALIESKQEPPRHQTDDSSKYALLNSMISSMGFESVPVVVDQQDLQRLITGIDTHKNVLASIRQLSSLGSPDWLSEPYSRVRSMITLTNGGGHGR